MYHYLTLALENQLAVVDIYGFSAIEYFTMSITLYRKQRQVFDFISQFIKKHGYSPTLQEIADAIGVSSLGTVHEHLSVLEKKGVIKRVSGADRGITVLKSPVSERIEENELEIPLLGFIAAGSPIEPVTDYNETVRVWPSMISGKRRVFALKVKGNSMINDGIFDGDCVIVEQQDTANNGQIVVALTDKGVTLKRFYKEKTRIRLESANPKVPPIFARNLRVQGRVVTIIRRFDNN